MRKKIYKGAHDSMSRSRTRERFPTEPGGFVPGGSNILSMNDYRYARARNRPSIALDCASFLEPGSTRCRVLDGRLATGFRE
jgi:hypothetical protein